MDTEEDLLSGFTLAADIIGISAILSGITHAKLYKGPAFDGTKNASAYTTRVAATYGSPDANGVYELAGPFSFPGIATVENTWGVAFWTAATGGTCLMVRRFADMKYVFVGDTLTVVSAKVFSKAVDL